jgi:hypothetical protein
MEQEQQALEAERAAQAHTDAEAAARAEVEAHGGTFPPDAPPPVTATTPTEAIADQAPPEPAPAPAEEEPEAADEAVKPATLPSGIVPQAGGPVYERVAQAVISTAAHARAYLFGAGARKVAAADAALAGRPAPPTLSDGGTIAVAAGHPGTSAGVTFDTQSGQVRPGNRTLPGRPYLASGPAPAATAAATSTVKPDVMKGGA